MHNHLQISKYWCVKWRELGKETEVQRHCTVKIHFLNSVLGYCSAACHVPFCVCIWVIRSGILVLFEGKQTGTYLS